MEKKDKENPGEGVAAEGSALGLDVGTSRLVLATGSPDRVKSRSELNAFIAVPYSKFTENILKQNKVSYQLNGGTTLQVFGNEAAQFANVFNAEVRRPMMGGTLNPSEEYSLPVMTALIQQLVKRGKGNDILNGGSGADYFVFEPQLGADRVIGFNFSEGDKLLFLDFFTNPMTAHDFVGKYAKTVGSDTVITLAGGSVTLVGITDKVALEAAIAFSL